MGKNEMLRILGSTVIWLIALTFFAYPALFGIIIDRTQDFCMKYYENQMQAVSIISNESVVTLFLVWLEGFSALLLQAVKIKHIYAKLIHNNFFFISIISSFLGLYLS